MGGARSAGREGVIFPMSMRWGERCVELLGCTAGAPARAGSQAVRKAESGEQ